MKTNRRNKCLCAGLLAVAVVAAAVQWNSAAKLRRENEELASASREVEQLARENADILRLRAENAEVEKLRAETRDLLKLRNEVRQLRDEKPELEKLRAENQRIAAQIKSNSVPRPKLSDMPGFVAKETWVDAGFATPEATVRTFIWAMSQGNVSRLIACFPPDSPEARGFIDPDTGKPRENVLEEMKQMTNIKGFRVSTRKEVSADEVMLGVQVSTGGEIMPLPLRRVGQEWKLDQGR